MKYIIRVLLIVMSLSLMVACSDKGIDKNIKGYTKYDKEKFSFQYPNKWNEPKLENNTIRITLPDGKSTISFTTSTIADKTTVDKYVDKQKSTIAKIFSIEEKDIKITKNKYHGYDMRMMKYDYSTMTLEQTVFMSDKTVVIVTYTSLKNDFKTYSKDVTNIVKTLKYNG